jgi:hypothetical protein
VPSDAAHMRRSHAVGCPGSARRCQGCSRSHRRLPAHGFPQLRSGRCDDPTAEPSHLRTVMKRLVAHGFPRSAPPRYDRGGCRCPLYPGDGGALPAGCRARPSPAASQRPVPAPRDRIPPAGLRITRHQRGFTRFTRPACPWPVATRMGRAALGRSPVLRTPPLPAAHDRAGPGVEHAPGTTLPT